ncbi:unnamed protein product [Lymnaea stagnalis]|uniref:Uncharacterized protein n=1 Tax=Lymnaea stagnalis TaxID=6523 RepID=A0AAV2HI23_LYMST
MQKLTELLVGILVIFALNKEGSTERPLNGELIVFMDPLDFKTKSCPDGYVHDVDYFIVSGFVNVTTCDNPLRYGRGIVVFVWRGSFMDYAWHTYLQLWKTTCRNEPEVPPNSCRCLSVDDKQLRVKCNLTIIGRFIQKRIVLVFLSDGYYGSEASEPIPYVYGNTSCIKWGTQSRNQGLSLIGENAAMSGIVIICTALFSTVSSLFSHGQ